MDYCCELMKFFVFTYAIQGNALYVQYGRKSLENTYMLVVGNLLILKAFFISICLITTINYVFFSLYLSNCNINHLYSVSFENKDGLNSNYFLNTGFQRRNETRAGYGKQCYSTG